MPTLEEVLEPIRNDPTLSKGEKAKALSRARREYRKDPANATWQYEGIDQVSGLGRYYSPELQRTQVSANPPPNTTVQPPPPTPPPPPPPESTADDAVQSDPETESTKEKLSVKDSKKVKDAEELTPAQRANREYIEELAQQKNQGRDGLGVYTEDFNKSKPVVDDDAWDSSYTGGQDDGGEDSDSVMKAATKDGKGVIISDNDITPNIETRDNKLDPYSNYTYNFDLYALDAKAFNAISKNRNAVDEFKNNLLISSGGKKIGRNAKFGDDFYIDDVEIDSIAPTMEQTKGTHSANIQFTVFEPYGVSLLERLIDVAQELGVKSEQYTRLPYMLRITFVGYDDNGVPRRINDTEKLFLLSVWDLKFTADGTGSKYTFRAVPYAHEAFTSKIDTLPSDIEITANTVVDMLGRTGVASISASEERFDNSGNGDTDDAEPEITEKKKNRSLEDIINRYEEIVTQKGSGVVPNGQPIPTKLIRDEFRIIIDDEEIKNARIKKDNFDPDQYVTQKSKENLQDFYKSKFQSYKKSFKVTDVPSKANALRVNAGTSLVDVIGIVLLHSSYIHDQFKGDPSKVKLKSLKWYKITPEIELKDWDEVLGRFAYIITYRVTSFPINNVKVESRRYSVPRGNIKGFHKKYDYIFTGHNDKVLGFDIKYNVAYHTVFDSSNIRGDESTAAGTSKNDGSTNIPSTSTTTKSTQTSEMSSKNTSGKGALTQDLVRNVLTNGIDLFNLKMEVIGDPDYVMQNDMFSEYRARRDKGKKGVYLPSGSIDYDASSLYVQVNFKTPVDYDSQTGLMNLTKDRKYNSSTQFSGIYEVWKVRSSFSSGMFQQDLFGFRIIDAINKEAQTQEQRKEETGKQKATDSELKKLDTKKNKTKNDSKISMQFILEDDPDIPDNSIFKGNIRASIEYERRKVEREAKEELQRRSDVVNDLGSLGA